MILFLFIRFVIFVYFVNSKVVKYAFLSEFIECFEINVCETIVIGLKTFKL